MPTQQVKLNKDRICDRIKDMTLFIKKWWLLENLRREIYRHSGYQSLEEVSAGREVLLSPQFFIAGRKDLPQYPGLAEKFLWWKWKYKPDKLKKRIKEYNDIFKVCIEEGYVKMIKTSEGFMPSTATSKAFKISEIPGLLEALLSEYKSVWTMIIFPIVSFILGVLWSPNLKSLLESVWSKIF